MFVMFGWLKETRPVRPLFECYCYVCQRSTPWNLWRETEWVTLFSMRTLPFTSKDSLACERCGDEAVLARPHSQRLQRGEALGEAPAFIEAHQFVSKTEVQRNFLRSTRVVREEQMTN